VNEVPKSELQVSLAMYERDDELIPLYIANLVLALSGDREKETISSFLWQAIDRVL
jgi:hypothetical protein